MGFFKSLFGGQTESPEEQQKEKQARDFEVLKFDGIKALRVRQMEHAIRCFETALDIEDDLEIHDYLSQAFIQTNQLDEALQHLAVLTEAEPDNVGILLRIANVNYMQEDYDAMNEVCQKALDIDEMLDGALMLMARAKIGQERTDEAVEVLTKAITQDEEMGDARLLRANTLLKANRTEEAETDAAWLMERAPEHEDVLMLMARIAHQKGNDEEALSYYDKVVDVNPFSAEAYRERAAIKQLLGDEEGYNEDMQSALEIIPENAEEDIEQKMKEAYSNSNPMGI
ncbi:MAG: tetratricopeptide repeat protein [Prevotella sp.]|nr:tetratricopeptide repeat protein [Prevotella sp.]